MKKLLLAAALLGAASAADATVTFNFDDLTPGNSVGAYNGAVFNNFLVQNGFGPTSAPNFAYNSDVTSGLDYAAGFTSLSFTSGVFTPATVSVYSGLGGTGTLLGSITVTNPPSDPGAFALNTVTFSGSAHSIVVLGAAGQFGWDDIVLGSVPEPATWALMIVGFGLVGTVSRRRKAVAA